MRKLFAALLLGACLAGPTLAGEAPTVVATIKPVHSLVAGVMDGIGQPQLLLKGGAEPHTYALKPSDALSLRQAAVVFWIGPNLEAFLSDSLPTLAAQARRVALAEAAGITRRENLEADEDDDKAKALGHAHGHDADNPHVWLDPLNAVAMVRAIADELSRADPANTSRYAANAAGLEGRLVALDDELGRALRPLAGRPYVVFHDAFRHLEARYGLAPAAIITVSPEVPASAARVAEVRRLLESAQGVCVFAEPAFEPKLIRALAGGTSAVVAELDDLGINLAAGPTLYFEMMRRNGRALRACLEVQG